MKSSRCVRFAAAGALAAALVLAAPATASAVSGWITQQLTFDARDRSSASVSGNRVVWLATDGVNYQVYTWKWGVDSTPALVAGSDMPQSEPRVSGDRVVWQELVDGGPPFGSRYQIFTIRVGAETTATRVSTGDFGRYDCYEPGVSGDRIVWRTSSGTSNQIATFKAGVDTTPTFLHGNENTHYEPRVSGDRVIWAEMIEGYKQIFTWKSGVTTQLTSDAAEHYVPAVSGDRVVWEAPYKGFNQIFTRKVGTDSTATVLSTSAESKDDPSVSGDRVIWSEFPAGLGQVMTRRVGADTTPKTASNRIFNLRIPKLSGDRAVWTNGDSGASRVYTRKLGTDSTSTVLATGDSAQSIQEAMVSGDRVVWLQYSAGTTIHQIVVAKRVTKPTIARSPGSSTITVKRKKGVAKYTLAATFKDADGTLMVGKTVYLQTSSNGKTRWKNTCKLTTNASGKASKSLSWKTKGSRYYRWYSPAATGYLSCTATKQTVKVR